MQTIGASLSRYVSVSLIYAAIRLTSLPYEFRTSEWTYIRMESVALHCHVAVRLVNCTPIQVRYNPSQLLLIFKLIIPSNLTEPDRRWKLYRGDDISSYRKSI
jgi:hypothetical protein